MEKEGEKVFVSNVYEGLPGSDGSVHFFQSQRCFSAAPQKTTFAKTYLSSALLQPSPTTTTKKFFLSFRIFLLFSHSYKLLLFFLSSNTPIFLSKSVSSFFFPSFYHLSSFVFFSFLVISRFSNIFFSIFASFLQSALLEANFLATFTLFFFPYTRALFLPFFQFILVPFVPF